jgi:hypothetical protein
MTPTEHNWAAPKNRVKLEAMFTVPTIILKLAIRGRRDSVVHRQLGCQMRCCCYFVATCLVHWPYSVSQRTEYPITALTFFPLRRTEKERQTEREREREFLLQPSVKKTVRKNNFINNVEEKNLFCNCSCPMPSRATKREPMRDHPGFYLCNWMLILGGWFVEGGRTYITTTLPTAILQTSCPRAQHPHPPSRPPCCPHTHTHTLHEVQALPKAWKLDMLGRRMLPAGQDCDVFVCPYCNGQRVAVTTS